jgi:hypothetical protein
MKNITKLIEIPEFHFITKTVFSTRAQMLPFPRQPNGEVKNAAKLSYWRLFCESVFVKIGAVCQILEKKTMKTKSKLLLLAEMGNIKRFAIISNTNFDVIFITLTFK